MAEFCSLCEPDYFDLNLASMALELEPGHSENFICEGCNIRSVYKDESGKLYLGRNKDGEIELENVKIEDL